MEQGSYCGSRGAGGGSSLTLHILAMAFMLCDHIWATLVAGQDWLTCVGRLAFPIFAFLLVEGFFHTRDLRRYVLRLLLLALLSEIPFDLMYAGTPFFPFHQNVIWTFLIALFCMWVIERAKGRGSLWLTALAAAGMSLAGWLAGTIAMVDYYGAGVLTVLVFYLFRGGRWWQRLGQAAGMFWINCGLLAGLMLQVQVLGVTVEFPQQGFALLALVPIWLYRGRQGYHSRWVQTVCYLFYPVHILVLAMLVRFLR